MGERSPTMMEILGYRVALLDNGDVDRTLEAIDGEEGDSQVLSDVLVQKAHSTARTSLDTIAQHIHDFI